MDADVVDFVAVAFWFQCLSAIQVDVELITNAMMGLA